jgi:hypothetical protein
VLVCRTCIPPTLSMASLRLCCCVPLAVARAARSVTQRLHLQRRPHRPDALTARDGRTPKSASFDTAAQLAYPAESDVPPPSLRVAWRRETSGAKSVPPARSVAPVAPAEPDAGACRLFVTVVVPSTMLSSRTSRSVIDTREPNTCFA